MSCSGAGHRTWNALLIGIERVTGLAPFASNLRIGIIIFASAGGYLAAGRRTLHSEALNAKDVHLVFSFPKLAIVLLALLKSNSN